MSVVVQILLSFVSNNLSYITIPKNINLRKIKFLTEGKIEPQQLY